MVRDPGAPGPRCSALPPPSRPDGSQPRQPRRTAAVLLHTCGHTCGQPRGAAKVGTPAADDLWAKVAAAVRAQLSEATWNTWFQGVHALELNEDTLILGVPSSVTIERLRTSYHGLLSDAAQALTGVPLDIALTRRHHSPPRGDGHARPAHASGRGPAAGRGTRRVDEVGAAPRGSRRHSIPVTPSISS